MSEFLERFAETMAQHNIVEWFRHISWSDVTDGTTALAVLVGGALIIVVCILCPIIFEQYAKMPLHKKFVLGISRWVATPATIYFTACLAATVARLEFSQTIGIMILPVIFCTMVRVLWFIND